MALWFLKMPSANPDRPFTLSKGHPASNACVNAVVLTPEVIGPSIFQLVLERASFCVNGMRFCTQYYLHLWSNGLCKVKSPRMVLIDVPLYLKTKRMVNSN